MTVPIEGGGDGVERASGKQSARLLRLVADAHLFHTPDGKAYATVPISGHTETLRVGSGDFEGWLARSFYSCERTAPSAAALSEAIRVLDAKARFESPTESIAVRMAEADGTIFVDLCDPDRRAVKITADGWEIVDHTPVRFVRPGVAQPLPEPRHGGSLTRLRYFVNTPNSDDFELLIGYIIACLRASGPYFILENAGEQGSAKTTRCNVLRSLIDPSRPPLRAQPRGEHDLAIAAQNGWILAFDNISFISAALSDALCRASSGSGYGTRKYYTDNDETVFEVCRSRSFSTGSARWWCAATCATERSRCTGRGSTRTRYTRVRLVGRL